jgi:O-antigen ligase
MQAKINPVLEKGKIPLSLAVLAVATAAVFYPVEILAGVGGIIFLTTCYRYPLFGIFAAILATLPGEFGRVELLGNSFLLLDLIAPVVLLTWIARKLIRRESFYFTRINTALLSFFAIAALSLVVGATELNAAELQFALLYLIRFATLGSFFFLAQDSVKKKSKVVNWLLLAGGILALVGFYLFKTIPDFSEAGLADLGWDPHIGRLTSTWLDPNFIAGGFAFLLALLGGKILHTREFLKQSWLVFLAGIMLAALLLTYSRSGLVALGFSGLVLGLVGNRKLLIALIIVGIIGMGVSQRLSERIGELAQSVTSLTGESQQVLDPTAQLRVSSWQEGLRIWKANPLLGVGYGTYKFHQTFASETSHAASGSDASLLNVAATTGILGFTAFLIFLGNLLLLAWQKRKTALGIGFLSAVCGLLIHSIFVNSLFFPAILLYLMISGGLLAAQEK